MLARYLTNLIVFIIIIISIIIVTVLPLIDAREVKIALIFHWGLLRDED